MTSSAETAGDDRDGKPVKKQLTEHWTLFYFGTGT